MTLKCDNCGDVPHQRDLLTSSHEAGDECPCCIGTLYPSDFLEMKIKAHQQQWSYDEILWWYYLERQK